LLTDLVIGKMDFVHWQSRWKVPSEAMPSVGRKRGMSGAVRPDRRHDHDI